MAKILVTGGAGFIGSHLADYLISKNHEVTILDDLSGGLERNINAQARFVKGSITDKGIVEKTMKNQEFVYHLAAYAAEGLSHFIRRYNYMNNLIGSINLINAAIKNKVRCFVFTSSMAVYGSAKPPFDESITPSPEDPYGAAKYAVEIDLKMAREMFGLNHVIIRPHNIYGERQFLGDPYRNVIGIWMNRIMQGKEPLIYGDGEQTRAFSYISDLIPCLAESAFIENARNEIINLGAGKPYTLNQLAKEIKEAMNSDLGITYVEARKEVKHAYSTTEKSEQLLGFKDTIHLQEGLAKMAKWAKHVGPMEPIVWESYELEENIPEFWKNLKKDYSGSGNRINPESF